MIIVSTNEVDSEFNHVGTFQNIDDQFLNNRLEQALQEHFDVSEPIVFKQEELDRCIQEINGHEGYAEMWITLPDGIEYMITIEETWMY